MRTRLAAIEQANGSKSIKSKERLPTIKGHLTRSISTVPWQEDMERQPDEHQEYLCPPKQAGSDQINTKDTPARRSVSPVKRKQAFSTGRFRAKAGKNTAFFLASWNGDTERNLAS